MRKLVTGFHYAWILLVGLGLLAACGNKADLEEIKANQQKILAKLATIEKKSGRPTPARPTRPPIDYSKVHKIRTEGVAYKGAKNPKVTIVEFTDYQ